VGKVVPATIPRVAGAGARGRSKRTRVAVVGLGGVGKALLGLMEERRPELELVGVADSKGSLSGKLDPSAILRAKRQGPLPPGITGADFLYSASADVVVDVTACDFRTTEPSLSVILNGFEAGSHVATANKMPLARFWKKVTTAATERDRLLGCTGATGAALPALAVARSLARMDGVTSIEGILTGTTSFILNELERGETFEAALQRAQEQGIAEPDPTVDIGGWDTAAKMVILANTVWDTNLTLDSVRVRGLEPDLVAAQRETPLRLIGRASRKGDVVDIEVGPSPLEGDHPLASLRGSEKGVVFRGPNIGHVVVSGGRSSPRAAAAAVLGDVLQLAQ
jgi:homoserine dehydrogenase